MIHMYISEIQDLLIKRILLLEQQQQQRWFYSVVCMANTKPAVDNIETLEYIQKKVRQQEFMFCRQRL